MKIQEAVAHVRSKFHYRKDPRLLDYWGIMKEKDGVMQGDCEDFSLTSFWKACDENLLKFILKVFILHQYRIYFSLTHEGERHAVGYADGLWFDNWTREALPKEEFLERTKHRVYFFFPSILIIFPMLLGLLVRNR